VKAGDTIDKLVHRMAGSERAVERFRVLNGLSEHSRLKPGDLVKVVVD
jgi:predicted Zn-dependent protease